MKQIKHETYEQERKIRVSLLKWLEEKDIYIPIKHVSNSASIIDLDGFRKRYGTFRIITIRITYPEGISKRCIGFKTSDGIKTHIIYIKEVEAEKKESVTITHM